MLMNPLKRQVVIALQGVNVALTLAIETAVRPKTSQTELVVELANVRQALTRVDDLLGVNGPTRQQLAGAADGPLDSQAPKRG